MAKIIDEWEVPNEGTILTLDEDTPFRPYWHYVIDGVEYEPVMVYDMGENVIAIKAYGSFIGKTVEFK